MQIINYMHGTQLDKELKGKPSLYKILFKWGLFSFESSFRRDIDHLLQPITTRVTTAKIPFQLDAGMANKFKASRAMLGKLATFA